MSYIILEFGKARQLEIIGGIRENGISQPGIQVYLMGKFADVFIAIGQRLKSQRRYGTVLHAG